MVCQLSKPVDLLMKEILKKYNKDSVGWHVLVGKGSKGYYDVFITSPKELWQIKLDTIYRANPMGLGARIGKNRESAELFRGIPDYGLRPLSKKVMAMMMSVIKRGTPPMRVLREVMSVDPKPNSEITTPWVLQGPVMHSVEPLELISDKQKELDAKMNRELERLLHKKRFGEMYV
jgi:hypothetical protein